jgi:hypothetical protein
MMQVFKYPAFGYLDPLFTTPRYILVFNPLYSDILHFYWAFDQLFIIVEFKVASNITGLAKIFFFLAIS